MYIQQLSAQWHFLYRSYTVFLGGVLLWLFATTLHAQERRIKFEHLSIEDGLSQSTVNSIAQDGKGFLWFGTQDGLNRYDGYTFRNFKHSPSDSFSLPSSNWVEALATDRRGHIWVGTRNGLCRYVPEKEHFIHYSFAKEAIVHSSVNTVKADAKGNIWVGSAQGLSFIEITDSGKENIIHIGMSEQLPMLNHAYILSLHLAKNGEIWIGTASLGLLRLTTSDLQRAKLSQYTNSEASPLKLSNPKVNAIWEDTLGKIWAGTEMGLNHIDPVNNLTTVHYAQTNEAGLSENIISGGFCDAKGNIWIGTFSQGICLYEPQTKTFKRMQADKSLTKSLSDNNVIKAFLEDRTGAIWIGTSLGGANKYDRTKDKFRLYRKELTVSSASLNDGSVRSFYKDSNDYIWVGTQNGGLNRVDVATGAVTYYTHNPENANTISSNFVKTIVKGNNGELWLGTRKDGISKITFQKNGYTTTHYKADPAKENLLSTNEISMHIIIPEQ